MANNSIFVSYSRENSKFAKSLVKNLQNAGIEVWFDNNDIKGGSRWDNAIAEALDKSDTVIYILSKASVASEIVSDEISLADDKNKKIIPILLEDCEIPFRYRRLQYADFTKSKKIGYDFLIQALDLNKRAAKRLSKKAQGKSKLPKLILLLLVLVSIYYLYSEDLLDPYIEKFKSYINPVDYNGLWQTAKNENTLESYFTFLTNFNTDSNYIITENDSIIFDKASNSIKSFLPYEGIIEFKKENGDSLFDLLKMDRLKPINKGDFIRSKDFHMVKLKAYSQNYAQDALIEGDTLHILEVIPKPNSNSKGIWLKVLYGNKTN